MDVIDFTVIYSYAVLTQKIGLLNSWETLGMMVSDQLKAAIKASGETHYRIAKEAGVDSRTLDRFMEGNHIRSDTIDLLCEHVAWELRRKKRRGKKPKSARKKTQTK